MIVDTTALQTMFLVRHLLSSGHLAGFLQLHCRFLMVCDDESTFLIVLFHYTGHVRRATIAQFDGIGVEDFM